MIINGIAQYAMVLGAPRKNKFNEDNGVWSIDVVLDKETVKKLKGEGLGWKIKDDNEAYPGSYIKFKRNEFKSDKTKNSPVEIVDAQGKPWDQNKLIGNGSEVNIRFTVYEGFQKKQNVSINGIQVIKHVPYEKSEPFPVYGEPEGSGGVDEVDDQEEDDEIVS